MAAAGAGHGLSGGANLVQNGQVVPAVGLVVFAMSDKIGLKKELLMRFGRGGWRGQTVKGTVRQQTGNKWMVDWDLPSTSASITSRSYGRLWFKNNAKTDDSVNAGSIDGLAGSEEEHSSSSSSSQDSDGSSSDEDEEGGPRERSQRSSFAQRSLNFAENGGGPSSPSAASGAASGAPPAASPPAQAEGGVGPSPTRQSPRQQSQLPAHALLKTENVIWKKLDEGISIDPAAGHAWMRPGMTWRTVGMHMIGELDASARVPMHYVRAFMPREWKKQVLQWTNACIQEDTDYVQEWEVDAFLGVLTAFTILRVGKKESLWADGSKESFFEPQKFGSKFGISYKRFKFMMTNLIFFNPNSNGPSVQVAKDPWYKSRFIVDTYNSRVLFAVGFFT